MPFRTYAWTAHTAGLCVEKSWRLEARCDCGHVGHISAADLAVYPPGVTLGEIAERLRCSACGGQSGDLMELQDHAGGHRGNGHTTGYDEVFGQNRSHEDTGHPPAHPRRRGGRR